MLGNLFSLGIVFGLIGMLGWGVGDFVAAKLSRRSGNLRSLLWVYVYSIPILVGYLFFSKSTFHITVTALVLTLITGVLHTIGGLSFYRGFEVGKVSLVAAIASSWSVILVFAGIFLFGERLTAMQLVAIGLVILGSVSVSADVKELFKTSKFIFTDPGVPYALIAMLSWGFGWIFFNQAIKQVGWLGPNIIIAVAGTFYLVVYGLIKREKLMLERKFSIHKLAMFVGLASTIAYVGYSFGIERYLTSIVAPVAAANPLVTVVLAWVLLREKLEFSQKVGIFSIISGVVLLSF
jgi:drug/metabolite transporter (DMT)-like permease